jgi:SAM-dependent methyltransferase
MKPPGGTIQCGICGATIHAFLFSARDTTFRTTAEVFSIGRCTSCGVVQTVPRPPHGELGRYYPQVYFPVGGFNQAYYRRTIRPSQEEKLEIVRRHRSGGTLLDVGSGAGFFVKEAREKGFQAQGVEVSSLAVEFGVRTFGIPLTQGDIHHATFEAGSFDVITLWHVLEHLERPVETLRKVRALLKSSGVLIIAVPNFDSLQARWFKERWYHLDVPRHLYHFTPTTLGDLLREEGYGVVADYRRSREHDWAGILGSLVPLVPANGSRAGHVIRRVIGRPLARAAAAVESAFYDGATFTLVAEIKQ